MFEVHDERAGVDGLLLAHSGADGGTFVVNNKHAEHTLMRVVESAVVLVQWGWRMRGWLLGARGPARWL